MHPDTSHASPQPGFQQWNLQSQHVHNDTQSKRNKNFKQILASPGQTFNGEKPMEYKPWKDALQREVEGLAPTAAQWFDILQIRTSGEAYEMVQTTRVMYL